MRLPILRSIGALVALFMVSGVQAMVTYQYAGNTYPSITSDETPPNGTYDTTMRVEGNFTINAALTDTFGVLVNASPSSYTFTDGRTTLTDANSAGSIFVVVDSNGDIVNWEASFNTVGGLSFVGDQSFSIGTRNSPSSNPPGLDLGQINECLTVSNGACTSTGLDFAQVINNPGAWTVIPIPAAVWLFGSALGLLAWIRRSSV